MPYSVSILIEIEARLLSRDPNPLVQFQVSYGPFLTMRYILDVSKYGFNGAARGARHNTVMSNFVHILLGRLYSPITFLAGCLKMFSIMAGDFDREVVGGLIFLWIRITEPLLLS